MSSSALAKSEVKRSLPRVIWTFSFRDMTRVKGLELTPTFPLLLRETEGEILTPHLLQKYTLHQLKKGVCCEHL